MPLVVVSAACSPGKTARMKSNLRQSLAGALSPKLTPNVARPLAGARTTVETRFGSLGPSAPWATLTATGYFTSTCGRYAVAA
jgi:hypothetical protein